MLLSMIWLTGAVLVSLWCCHKYWESEKTDDYSGSWYLGAMIVLTVALAITKDTIVMPVYQWLLFALPEQGTVLNVVTATVLTGIACLAFAGGIPLVYSMMLIMRDGKNKARQSMQGHVRRPGEAGKE